MVRKKIVVLANSWKKGGRCLAGKEIYLDGNEIQGFGSWIRPISQGTAGAGGTSEGGQVTEETMRICLNRNNLPKVLEVIDIPLEEPAGLADQPENWLLADGVAWTSLGVCEKDSLSGMLDAPAELWDTSGQGWGRVEEWIPKGNGFASLYLVESQGALTAEIGSRPKFQGSNELKRFKKLKLPYGGVTHEFTISDPAFDAKYSALFPPLGEATVSIALPAETKVCVSLTPAYSGSGLPPRYHYKMAAALI